MYRRRGIVKSIIALTCCHVLNVTTVKVEECYKSIVNSPSYSASVALQRFNSVHVNMIHVLLRFVEM